MESKALAVIERYQMLTLGATVIVAFSGGADSIALLSFLNSIKNDYNIKLIAAHVNHGIRGKEANDDEDFVKRYCKKIAVQLKVLHADIPSISKQTGESVEECGRRIRYEFFESIDKNALVATAHTQSDNAETVLFNLTRGTALKGLCGIPAMRSNIIRPLIECSRRDIEDYCKRKELDFVTDSTNSEIQYSRNRIRHNVIAQLEQINPAFTDAVGRCVLSIKQDDELLTSLADIAKKKAEIENGFDANLISLEHIAIRKRVLSDMIFKNCGVHPEQKHIDAADAILHAGGQVQVCSGCYIRVKNGIIDFPNYDEQLDFWSVPFQINVTNTPSGIVDTRIINNLEHNCIQKINKTILDNCVDYDKIDKSCVLRSRNQGDDFSPHGRKITKSLKKLFNEAKIPTEKRNSIIVLANDEEIFWIEGFGPSEKASLTKETQNILEITIRR